MNNLVILLIVAAVLYYMFYFNSNKVDAFENLQYGSSPMPSIATLGTPKVMGPNSSTGPNKQDFNKNEWGTDPKVDLNTFNQNDTDIQARFQTTYSLDPENSVTPFDLTQNKVSTSCCPTQYAPPHKLSADSDCLEKDKYIANPYSAMNMYDGTGCSCMTQDQANFYGSRGGNA